MTARQTIKLPKGVVFTEPDGEFVDPRGQVIVFSPYAGLSMVDGDWSLSVTVMPVKRDGDRVALGELDADALDGGDPNAADANPKPWPDASQERWDASVKEALDFLLRMKAGR